MALVMEFLQYSIYLFFVFVQFFHVIGGQSVGTPTSPTVCNGAIATLTCDITQSTVAPNWRVFTTSDTSGMPEVSLGPDSSSPPYNYPKIQPGDTVARLEVNASSNIDGYHFQCRIPLLPTPVDSPGTGTITLTDTPSCSTSCTESRNEDFTTVSVSCQQPPTTPPVTSTTVTYCPTSSPNCGNSMNCTTSPCTISGLNTCEGYQLTVVPNNKCGSPTGCTGNIVMSVGQDMPSCPIGVLATNVLVSNFCNVSLTWEQPPSTPQVTLTTVTYRPGSIFGNSTNCTTNPCTISGLDPGTEYQFTVIPSNNCGSPTGCTGNTDNVTTPDSCIPPLPPTPTLPVPAIAGGVAGGVAGLAIASLATYAIAVLIAILCCASCKGRSYCHVFFCQYCCGGDSKRPSSTRPLPADDYADPKKVREKKEKEDKIQYAALEFSEQAGSSGEKPIRSKEEPVQYLSVEQA